MPTITLTDPQGATHTLTPPPGASDEEIQSVISNYTASFKPAPRAQTAGEQAFTSAQPGSEERKAAIPQLQAETEAADRAKSVAEAGVNVPLLGKVSLPQAGSIAATAVPGASTPGIRTAASAAGGAAGTLADEGLRVLAGLPGPSAGEIAKRAGVEAGQQAALQAGGEALFGAANRALAPQATDATKAVYQQGQKAGIPATLNQVLDAGPKANPLTVGAKLNNAIVEDVENGLVRSLGTRTQAGVPAETREAIEHRLNQLTTPLPTPLSEQQAGISHKQYTDALLDTGKKIVRRAYADVDQYAALDPKATAVPSHLEAAIKKWKGQADLGLDHHAVLDELTARMKRGVPEPELVIPEGWKPGEPLSMSPPAPQPALHFSELNQIRKDLGARGWLPSQPGLAPPPKAMIRDLYHAIDRDIGTIQNPVLQQLDQTARQAYMAYEAPFKKGGNRVLHNLVNQTPENFVRAFSGPKGAQYVRELKAVAAQHPAGAAGIEQIKSQVMDDFLGASRESVPIQGGVSRLINGKRLYNNALRMEPVLDELFGAGHADDMRTLGRVIEAAQQTPKGSIGRKAMEAFGLFHFGLGSVPIFFGMKAAQGLMQSKLGLRWLAEGFLPRTQSVLSSQPVRAGAGAAVKMGYQLLSPEERKQVEASLPPEYHAQVAAATPGPNGQPPEADIGGQKHVFDPMITVAAKQNQVSPQLMKAIFAQESGFNPQATSKAGAQGIAQLMPKTAQDLGVRNPYDPFESIPAATRHMAGLLQRYGGDKEKALAAYNAGPGRVDEHGGVPPIKETQNYVKQVLEREKSYEKQAPEMNRAPEKQMSWSEMAQKFAMARRGGNESAWREIRTQVNKRINAKLGHPTLGMNPQDYQRYLPMIVEALKPEPEQKSSESLRS